MALELVDTHCHIQESTVVDAGVDATRKLWAKAGNPTPDLLISRAKDAGVTRLLVVGCSYADSMRAIALAQSQDKVWASIGVHPHEATLHRSPEIQTAFCELASQEKVVAVGECGLDYFYEHSPKEDQISLLHLQFQLAAKHNLPMIFHVREAFEDFWPIFDAYPGIKGVIHSFTASTEILEQILIRNLYVGLNGIMTFTKKPEQLAAARAIPLDRMVLETDAPFLTPAPFRGKICEPNHIRVIGEFLATLRGESLEHLAKVTTSNAQNLFGMK